MARGRRAQGAEADGVLTFPQPTPHPPSRPDGAQLLEPQVLRGGELSARITEKDCRLLCDSARTIFLSEPPLLEVAAPVKIAGDVHGQYSDLLRLFRAGGMPPETRYLFMGDYVDRGKNSIETICLLMAFKVRYPNKIWLLRGNHECATINRIYGFFDECRRRFSTKIWKTFCDVFNTLPFAGIVDDKIFCCHGGLSPTLDDMDQIRAIVRPCDVPETGIECDLLWSDPDPNVQEWAPNDRGVSFTFGESAVSRFLDVHNLDLVCRAHQVVEDGYEFFAGRRLVTIFSAPNYCGEFDNRGAIMSVDETLMCSFETMSTEPVESPRRRIFGYSRPGTPGTWRK